MGKPPHRKLADRKLIARLKAERKRLTSRLDRVEADLTRHALSHSPTAAEVDRWLDEMAEGLPELPPLPANFSRADIYSDHD